VLDVEGKFSFSINDFKYSMDLDKDMFEFILSSYDKALSAVNSIFKDENVEENVLCAIEVCSSSIDEILGEEEAKRILKDKANDIFKLLDILLKIKNCALEYKKDRILSYLPERLGY